MAHKLNAVKVNASSCTSQDYVNFTTEASTVGFPPGVWPERVVFEDGSKEHVLYRSTTFEDGQDILAVLYAEVDGVRLKVYND